MKKEWSWRIISGLWIVLAFNICAGMISDVYWVESGRDKITRSAPDGSGKTDMVTSGLAFPIGVAVDLDNGHIYITDTSWDRIFRAPITGGGLTTIVSGLTAPNGISLDVAAGKIYWSDSSTNLIQRSNLDGSAVETVVSGLNLPRGVEVDPINKRIYWAEQGAGRVGWANLDDGTARSLVSGLNFVQDVGLDLTNEKVYFTEAGGMESPPIDRIRRVDFTGSNVTDVIAPLPGFSPNPSNVEVDPAGGKIYWTEATSGLVRRANLDGSSAETIASGLYTVYGLSLGSTAIPEPGNMIFLMGMITFLWVGMRRIKKR